MIKQQFYSLPLALDEVAHQRELGKCSLAESITQQLRLMLTTAFGELPGDETFGCSIWDDDFDIGTISHTHREYLCQSILESIKYHEKRLCNVKVDVTVQQQELLAPDMGRHLKKRVLIGITALLQATHEAFSYTDSFSIAPFSS